MQLPAIGQSAATLLACFSALLLSSLLAPFLPPQLDRVVTASTAHLVHHRAHRAVAPRPAPAPSPPPPQVPRRSPAQIRAPRAPGLSCARPHALLRASSHTSTSSHAISAMCSSESQRRRWKSSYDDPALYTMFWEAAAHTSHIF
jgi:hypothetical protein